MFVTHRIGYVTSGDMPSPDTLNLLFRNRPAFAVEMLRDRLGVDIPSGVPVQLDVNELNDRPSIDLRPDTVITVGPRHRPLHAVIVEIQQRQEESKRSALPRYAAALWLQQDCPVTVLMVCPQVKTAGWAAWPIPTSLPGYTLTCRVIGPEQIPMVTDPLEAARHPELAAMSVMAHGEHPLVAEAFMAALQHLPDDHSPQYYEYAYRLASQAARRMMEKIMESATWPVYSPFARKHYGKGLAEGEAKGEAKAVLTFLEASGIVVSDAARDRITACTDLVQLEEWVRRSVTATSTDDLFSEPN
jgi:hypothetical protein